MSTGATLEAVADSLASITSKTVSASHSPSISTANSSSALYHSSPESHSLDCNDVILEDEDETSSETMEPLTPTSETQPHFHHAAATHLDPLAGLLPTGITKEHSPLANSMTPPNATPLPPKPLPAAPTNPPAKRTTSNKLSALFRRSTSHVEKLPEPKPDILLPADAPAPKHSRSPRKKISSFSLSLRSSPTNSHTNSPPSPGSPSLTQHNADTHSDELPDLAKYKNSRASTGPQVGPTKVTFAETQLNPPSRPMNRKRSTSMSDIRYYQNDSLISIPAVAGAGLKARRLSTALPDDFFVETFELHDEFISTSKIPGLKGKVIGKGATASVRLMHRKGDRSHKLYAVKEFRQRTPREDEAEYVKKVKSEYSIAKSLHHPNIVETISLCTHNGRWNHVMEYCAVGELFTLAKKDYFTFTDRTCLFKQLLRGVAYLHSHGIAHRDLKLENLLMTSEGFLKISDFGVSEVFHGEHPGLRAGNGECGKNMVEGQCRKSAPGICGSLPYIAPEVLAKKGEYDPRTLDMWSCGIVFLTLRFGGQFWNAAEMSQPHFAIFTRGWEKFTKAHPDQMVTELEGGYPKCGLGFIQLPGMTKRLILQMLHPNPLKRITIHEALNNRWIRALECCSPEPLGPTIIDAAGKKSCKQAAKIPILKAHNHLPPKEGVFRRVHNFQINEGDY
ncbi:MAG: hypothetical protein M1829_003345 [Trizodia sp. TS-e1964]|nr:MAG: hypothetical protein M1829_003345 [Trizodia sp. TS-e1964]